jgi:hypothetical protein
MITHLVLFRPRPDLGAADSRAFAAALEHAFREIPTVRGVRVGTRVTHGAMYERAPQPDLTYAATLEFDDLAGLQTYLQHPAHEELGARLGSSVEMALVYDFEMRDVSDIGALLDK